MYVRLQWFAWLSTKAGNVGNITKSAWQQPSSLPVNTRVCLIMRVSEWEVARPPQGAPHIFREWKWKNIPLVIRALHRKSLNICDWFNRMLNFTFHKSETSKQFKKSKKQRINAWSYVEQEFFWFKCWVTIKQHNQDPVICYPGVEKKRKSASKPSFAGGFKAHKKQSVEEHNLLFNVGFYV